MYTSILYLVICLAVVNGANITESFCGCLTPDCCAITEIDFNLQNFFLSGTNPSAVSTVAYGNFSSSHVEYDVPKSNIVFFGTGALSCNQSFGMLFERDAATPATIVTFEQLTPGACLLNFSETLSETELRSTLDLVISTAYITDPLGGLVAFSLQENIVPYTSPTHTFVVEEDQNDDSVVALSLNIQTYPFTIHNTSCLEASNLGGMQFQFTPGGSAPGTLANCIFDAEAVIVNNNDSTVQITYDFLQADYTRCYRQDPSNLGQDIVYTFEVEPIIDGCSYYSLYDTYVFTITVDSELFANTTANVNSMILNYVQTSVSLEICTAEFNDINPLVPLARLVFTLEIDTAYDTVATSIILIQSIIEDLNLEQVGATVLTSLPGSNTRATFVLRTAECLFVDTEHSGTPNTQENLIGCSIDYLPPMDIVATATYVDGFTETNDLSGTERDIVFNSDNVTADCAGVVVPVNDVTAEYGAILVVEDLNGRTDSLNLNNPIVARIELTNVNASLTSGVYVVLNDIIVDLDGEYRRTYTMTDKIIQMQYDFSPYEQDGHFCRFFDANTDTCERFYQQTALPAEYSDNHWNAYLQTLYDVGPSGFFKTEAASRKYEGCQDLSTSAHDSFVFTPSDWIFKSFPRTTGIMYFEATAYLRACTPGGTRRLGEFKITSSRNLQDDNDVVITFNNVTIVSSTVTIGVTTSINSVVEYLTPYLTAVIVLLSVFICMLSCGCCWWFIVLDHRHHHDHCK